MRDRLRAITRKLRGGIALVTGFSRYSLSRALQHRHRAAVFFSLAAYLPGFVGPVFRRLYRLSASEGRTGETVARPCKVESLRGNPVVPVGRGKVAGRHARTRSHRSRVRARPLASVRSCPMEITMHASFIAGTLESLDLDLDLSRAGRGNRATFLAFQQSDPPWLSCRVSTGGSRSIDFRPFCPMMDRGLFRRGNSLRSFVLAESCLPNDDPDTFRVSCRIEFSLLSVDISSPFPRPYRSPRFPSNSGIFCR